jgi:hypothetical protein
VYHLYNNFSWTEDSITWNNKPSSRSYNSTYEDSVTASAANNWYSLTTKNIVRKCYANNYKNCSMLFKASGANAILFRTKEHTTTSTRPILNVTYQQSGQGGGPKGLVNTTEGATPFYTNGTNPTTITLNKDQCQNIVWFVNATGSAGSSYDFFAFANKTSYMSINNATSTVNITITS